MVNFKLNAGFDVVIKLTKLNNEEIVINSVHIQAIEIIPESKVILTNKDFFIVLESTDEIIDKIVAYNAKIYSFHKKISVSKNI